MAVPGAEKFDTICAIRLNTIPHHVTVRRADRGTEMPNQYHASLCADDPRYCPVTVHCTFALPIFHSSGNCDSPIYVHALLHRIAMQDRSSKTL